MPAVKADQSGVTTLNDKPAHLQWLLTMAIIAAVWFSFLGYRSLVEPDEARYAEIPREMVATGDYVTPRLNAI